MTRLSVVAASIALLLAALAGQNTLLAHTDAGAAPAPSQRITSYTVLAHGCGRADLYVLRYAPPGESARASVASWCG